MRQPDFTNVLKVLQCEVPDRPTLFEFFLNQRLYTKLVEPELFEKTDSLASMRIGVHAFKNAGYDYTTVAGSNFGFPTDTVIRSKTRSLNQGFLITDEESYANYKWPDPDAYDYSALEEFRTELPEGMKLIVRGPGGVLENVISLVGYENLCYMIFENTDLAQTIFDAVGSRLVRYYQLSAPYDTVGAVISNDDWGFKTQTMLSTADMRRFVFPWHKKIVAAIHAAEKPAILHSCGNLEEVMEDVITDMGYQAKHSYEDTIMPVEDVYEAYVGRIAILGGIDVDFICTASEAEIAKRSNAMLERSKHRGGYALGTGNSVPEYIPDAHYFAMINTVR